MPYLSSDYVLSGINIPKHLYFDMSFRTCRRAQSTTQPYEPGFFIFYRVVQRLLMLAIFIHYSQIINQADQMLLRMNFEAKFEMPNSFNLRTMFYNPNKIRKIFDNVG
jgi:hypothetical protein